MPMRSFPVRWLVAVDLLLALLLPVYGFAQDGASPAQGSQAAGDRSQTLIRATTRLVILDVVATDDRGEVLTGLKAEDFTALEDGKPQHISAFSFHRPGEGPAAPPQLPPNVVSNAPAYTSNSSMNIILLDAINSEFSSHAYAQDMLIRYLGTGPAIQPTAIFALEGKLELLHDFTTDTQALKEALAHFKPQGPEHIADVYSAASPFERRGSFKAGPNARQVTFRAMLDLAHSLSGYPGRKNLIWLSEGFPLNLFPDALLGGGAAVIEDYSPLVEKITDALMNAQVAVYPIDAAGVTQVDRFSPRTAMESVAERTGGRTFFNRNDIDVGVRTSIDDGSTYYTLEYYPDNRKWDGKFRRIELKVNRPGAKLRYREGYYALGPDSSAADPSAEFSRALDVNAPSSTAVRFQAQVTLPAQKGQEVLVRFAIDPHTIVFQRQSDDLQHGAVSCVVWAYQGRGNPVQFQGESKAALKPEVYRQVMQSAFPCSRKLDLKPGHYTLRLGVLDQSTNLIGSTSMHVTVP
jgi:VWFA-related protein